MIMLTCHLQYSFFSPFFLDIFYCGPWTLFLAPLFSKSIVLRPGFRVLTGSAGLKNFKSKRQRFSKKKSQRVCNRVLSGQSGRRVNPPGFPFPCFFFNPARFQLRVSRVPGWITGSGHVSKLWVKDFKISFSSNLRWI